MSMFVERRGASVGFGVSAEEAIRDTYINSCTQSLCNDVNNEFTARRKLLSPWMPSANMLHISGVGCLIYKDMMITEVASGNQVYVAATNNSIFYYLSVLFNTKLSYTDIVCVLREELDIFFQNISDSFVPIGDIPPIQVLKESQDFKPNVVYNTDSNFMIGCADGAIGIKHLGEDCFYVCRIKDKTEQLPALHYLLYRTGYVISADGSSIEELEDSYENN